MPTITTTSRQLDKRLSEFDKSIVVATYFGFSPIQAPKITKQDIEISENCSSHHHYDALEKAAFIRTYMEDNFSSLPHPLALIYRKPVSRRKYGTHSLHFVGSSTGIAEATLIRAALSILTEAGHKKLRVDINCIGDKESIAVYEKELIGHVKKLAPDLSDEIRQKMREDIFNIFRLDDPEALRIRETAPSSITFLSSASRAYFKEVLEYIEALGIDFKLSPDLVGDKNHSSHTVFAIKDPEVDENRTLAIGYRYSRLSRFLGFRKEIPMTGVTIFSSNEDEVKERMYKELPRPKFYLVQLGREAKIKTLSLLEDLRLHRIPVHHFIGRDKLTVQLTSAENLRVSHLIIVGQKEALDNTVTIRNMSTRAQDTVSMTILPQYLKKISL